MVVTNMDVFQPLVTGGVNPGKNAFDLGKSHVHQMCIIDVGR